MDFPRTTFEGWRALVDKELAGRSFDKVLVHEAFGGFSVLPLYVEAPPPDAAARHERREPFRICMRHVPGSTPAEWAVDAANGADALWVPLESAGSDELGKEEFARTSFVFEASRVPTPAELVRLAEEKPSSRFSLGVDPLAWRAEGCAHVATLDSDLEQLGKLALARGSMPGASSRGAVVVVSMLPYHHAGADAADEIAIGLSTGARYVEALLDAGLSPDEACASIDLRTAVGRDTFLELCKLRALRVCWAKMVHAFGATAARPVVHAVCSSSTLASRDPWVNMLRVTTQVFAAVIGGADLITPTAFDETLGTPSELGRRVARNTGLVLREESALGKVSDAAGGSYAFDALTDALAREAWSRFRQLSGEGGIVQAIASGRLTARLEASWTERLDRIAKRKLPILGVSEFPNLDETLPRPARPDTLGAAATPAVAHRDAEPFEALRLRADAVAPAPEVVLVTLGSFADSRARTGFSAAFFGAGGMRTRETTSDVTAVVVCLCGTDERYALEACDRARALKAMGARRVLVAGRPGALETPLREAGVDGFLFVGCDAVDVLSEALSTFVASEEGR